MKLLLHKTFRLIAYSFLVIIGFLVLYLIGALVLSCIPSNREFKPSPNGIDIYILSNGVHTDIVLPAKNRFKDWTKEIRIDNTIAKDTNINFMAFGWGDKGFYLETPTWSDLKFSTAIKAMFSLSKTAMHVVNYHTMRINDACKKVSINKEQYARLVNYIDASFSKSNAGNFLCIKNHCYGENDSFYEANGSYSLFHTCNTWANEGLRCSGIKACVWTPFDKGIFFHYRE